MGDFTFGKDFLSPSFLFFGKLLARPPPFPITGDFASFNGVTGIWELKPSSGLSVTTSSNVGTGAGWALPKVGIDLPFKSFIALAPLILTVNPNDITISILGGQRKALLSNCYDTEEPADLDFMAVVGVTSKAPIEIERQNVMPASYTMRNLTIQVNLNASLTTVTLNLRINGANGNQSITVPAGTTGTFTDSVNTDLVVFGDLLAYQNLITVGGAPISYVSASMEVLA